MIETQLLRGGVYLANLNPSKGSEPGKVRPVLILQNHWLNELNHPSVIVLPLSTVLIEDAEPLRFRLQPRDRLHKTSDVLCDQIRALDVRRITSDCLTLLPPNEMQQIEQNLQQVLGFSNRQ
ncbi:MAG: type II toxin-antitoxin system PemK/MazF family toxin [Hydrogenovibrio sp.]|uniref:type II toxin-antitoxin system PemK/MazF family toxin n=1 Tax=Hydrogenovibrio TaxID=28884 RepID=UPI0003730003|nr:MULTISPECIES: type II toxin-antitoxin system PemK/MazF family toxin [Hydrogenovibrio]MDR9499714.1 type II toxin-antitoxin system PemK/MazF family toxin [Hydrogenovibrio sp.]